MPLSICQAIANDCEHPGVKENCAYTCFGCTTTSTTTTSTSTSTAPLDCKELTNAFEKENGNDYCSSLLQIPGISCSLPNIKEGCKYDCEGCTSTTSTTSTSTTSTSTTSSGVIDCDNLQNKDDVCSNLTPFFCSIDSNIASSCQLLCAQHLGCTSTTSTTSTVIDCNNLHNNNPVCEVISSEFCSIDPGIAQSCKRLCPQSHGCTSTTSTTSTSTTSTSTSSTITTSTSTVDACTSLKDKLPVSVCQTIKPDCQNGNVKAACAYTCFGCTTTTTTSSTTSSTAVGCENLNNAYDKTYFEGYCKKILH